MQMKFIYSRVLGIVAVLTLAAVALAPTAHAGNLSSDVIGLFPNTVGEFAYADMRQARSFPWFTQLRDQMIPSRFKQFEQFLTTAGMDPDSQVEEVAWALVPTGTTQTNGSNVPSAEQIVGVAMGQFQPAAVEAYFKSKKAATEQARGYTIYGFNGNAVPGDIAFMFLDANTAAFGQRDQLEQMVDVRLGQRQSITANSTIYPLISQANGHGIVWAVLNPAYTRLAMQQLLPGASQFAQAAPLLAKIQSMLISVQPSNGIEADFQATFGSPDDAASMSALLQAGLMLVKYQANTQNNSALAQMLDGAHIDPNGDRVNVSVGLTNDQVMSLIQAKTFVLQ
jgi:hypothetical protein